MKTCEKCGRPSKVINRAKCGACYQVWRTRQHAYGRFVSKFVPVAEAKAHLERLQGAGVGQARVAELTGLSRHAIYEMGRRPVSGTCFRKTAEQILAIPVPAHPHGGELASGAKVSAAGTVRRLRALTAAGYTSMDIAERLKVHHQIVSYLQLGHQPSVTAKTARAVDRLFRELQLVPGPSDKARNRAARRGWNVPFSWDENEIDNPLARPHVARKSAATRLDEYRDLKAMGLPDVMIAERMGIKRESLEQLLRRAA